MFYASFGMLSIVIHLIINFPVLIRRPKGKDNHVWRSYRSFLLGVLTYYVSDVLWGFLYDLKIVPLVYADTVLYFLAMGLSLFMWMRFIVSFINKKGVASKLLVYSGWGIFLFQIVTLTVNFFLPIMFYFDKAGEYYPQQARYIALGLQIILFIVLSLYALILSIRKQGQTALHYRAIAVSGLVMAVFIILQTKYPLLPFYAIGCLIATCILHTFVIASEKITMEKSLGNVKQNAYRDPLTRVRNVNAYTETKNQYDEKIREKSIQELGIVVFDVNNLKKINDTKGHEAGDRYLQDCCMLICKVFKHSPVFRIGGDEFVALLESEDYLNREGLFETFNEAVEENVILGGAVVSGGMDIYHPDSDTGYDEIFKRADEKMYKRKKELKGER